MTHGLLATAVFSVVASNPLASHVTSLPSGRDTVPEPRDVHVEERVACPKCRIVLGTPTMVIGRPPDGFDDWPYSVARDSRGRFYITQPNIGEPPIVTNSRGVVTGRLGRKGAGPGEFNGAAIIAVAAGDSVFVFDPRTSRISLFDPSGRFVRSAVGPVETLGMVWIQPRDQLLVNAIFRDPERIGLPFHYYDRLGHRTGGFGPPRPEVLPGETWSSTWRVFEPIDAARFVAATVMGHFAVELWTTGGHLETRYTRRVDPLGSKSEPAKDGAPAPIPHLVAVHRDRSGRVWTLIQTADPKWRNGVKLSSAGREGWKVDDLTPHRYWDTLIEVLDPVHGVFVARTRVDAACRMFLDDDTVVCDGRNADGSYRLDIRDIRLAGLS